MPLYDYRCRSCGRQEERIAKIDETELTCDCGGSQDRQLHGRFGIIMGAAGAHGYYDENLGVHIRTNTHRREVMREQGVEEKIGKGWV